MFSLKYYTAMFFLICINRPLYVNVYFYILERGIILFGGPWQPLEKPWSRWSNLLLGSPSALIRPQIHTL